MRTASTVVLIVVSGPAFAEPIPKSDVAEACRTFAAESTTFGTEESRFQRCVSREQVSYDRLKLDWGRISEQDQRACIQKGPLSGMMFFYGSIIGCVIERIHDKQRLDEEKKLRELSVQH